jgi:hypothetical protein
MPNQMAALVPNRKNTCNKGKQRKKNQKMKKRIRDNDFSRHFNTH